MTFAATNHSFSAIYLHINWHCKEDRALLHGETEKAAHRFIEDYTNGTKGLQCLGVGGTQTHIHLAVKVQPFVTPSDWIGKLKGACSHSINQQFGKATLQWQRGYGVVSFAEKNLPAVLRYIENQKEHHQKGNLKEMLEAWGGE